MTSVSFSLFYSYALNCSGGHDIDVNIFVFATTTCPRLKKRYHARVEKVREYLETVKDFDELISNQSLFLHFLGLEPSTHVQRNIEITKKSKFVESSFG